MILLLELQQRNKKTRKEWALDMKGKGKAICIFCEYYSPTK
jgi:hypothetical protein